MKTLKCATFNDDLNIVKVEASLIAGLPSFNIAGLASTAIKESENRIKSAFLALKNQDSELIYNCIQQNLRAKKVLINLSPSDIPKKGSHFDLAIALVLALWGKKYDEQFFVFGELGLDGAAKSTSSLFSILLFLSLKSDKISVLVPKDIAQKAAHIPKMDVYAISNLGEAIRFFTDEEFKKSCHVQKNMDFFQETIDIDGKIYVPNFNFELDFKDVKGQKRAKRASLISACGMHNILFEGSPGSGKSMCAKRIRYIMPPQTIDEILLNAAYESLNNMTPQFKKVRPFRNPHHSSTRSSIFGGGSYGAKIGEVALANGGELFFDELPHFNKSVLESLREPLEDNQILISRVHSKVKYQTKFLFAAAQNPCLCGNLFSKNVQCTCSPIDIKRYKRAISGPLLDRIDIYVAMEDISKDDICDISSAQMYDEVLKVFKIQKKRGQSNLNGKMSDDDISRFCLLDFEARTILDKSIYNFNLSQRGINKVLKVARTISDILEKDIIQKQAILESLSYRMRIV